MKKGALILPIIVSGLFLISQLSHADEIYKWVDEKGTVHLTDDPKTIPEKYRDQVQIKTFKESTPTMPLKRDITETRQKQAPVGSQQGKESQYGRPVLAYDPTNDPEYQQMINKLDRSIYYQRDIYQPGTQRVTHRAGELISGGPDTAQNLKEELDRLVSNPEFGRDTQYRRDVKNFFDSHFYERDVYFPRGQSIIHSKGEIKTISTEHDLEISGDIQNQKWYGPDGYIELKDGNLYTPKGIYYASSKNKWSGPGGYITLSGGNLFIPGGGIYYPSN